MSRHKKIILLAYAFLTFLSIVACGKVKEDEFATNQQESNAQEVEKTGSETKEDETVNAEESSVNQQENGAQAVESINPETFPLGEYQDDMGSQLIISKADDEKYIVTFGIYKLAFMENAEGNYDAVSGILSFSGTDDMGNTLSADVAIKGENLIVTITHSEYGSDCSAGTEFEFEPYRPKYHDDNMSLGMEERYKAILLGDGDFVNIDRSNQDIRLSLESIKEVVSDEDWVTAEVIKFTVIDLDGNGENEIVLWIQSNNGLDYGFEILYFQDQEVYGFTLPYRGFMDLKTDGTFYSSGGMDNRGIRRLRLSERGYTIEEVSESESQEEKTDVEWYDLTPDNVELAF